MFKMKLFGQKSTAFYFLLRWLSAWAGLIENALAILTLGFYWGNFQMHILGWMVEVEIKEVRKNVRAE